MHKWRYSKYQCSDSVTRTYEPYSAPSQTQNNRGPTKPTAENHITAYSNDAGKLDMRAPRNTMMDVGRGGARGAGRDGQCCLSTS